RTQWQIFTLTIVLNHVERYFKDGNRGRARNAHSKSRDFPGNRQVSVEMRCRNRQRAREVVETAVCRFVAGQQWLDVDVERKEIPYRVVVFRPIEAMNRGDAAWIRTARPRAIDVLLQRDRQRVGSRRVWTRTPGRRHRARSKLADDLFPNLGVGA